MLSNQRLDVYFNDGFYYLHNKTSSSLNAILYSADDVLLAYPLESVYIAPGVKHKFNLDYETTPSYYLYTDMHLLALVNPVLINDLIDKIMFDLACNCVSKNERKKNKKSSNCSKCNENKEKTDCEKHNHINNVYRLFMIAANLSDAFKDYAHKLNVYMLEEIDMIYYSVMGSISEVNVTGEYCSVEKYHKIEMIFFYKYLARYYGTDFDFKMNDFNRCLKGEEIDISIYDSITNPMPKTCIELYDSYSQAINDPDLEVGARFAVRGELYNNENPTYINLGTYYFNSFQSNNIFPNYNGTIPIYRTTSEANLDNNLAFCDEYVISGSVYGQAGELYTKLRSSGQGIVTNNCYIGHDNEEDAINNDFLRICDEWTLTAGLTRQLGKNYLKTKKIV